MQVRDVLKGKDGMDVVTARPSDDVGRAVELLMEHRIGGLPVLAPGGAVLGFVSERDVVEVVHSGCEQIRRQKIDEIMATPPPICQIDDPLQEVMTHMTRERLRHLVVVEDDEIAGILSIGDLVKHRIRELETEAGVLRDYVAGQRASR